MITKAIPFLDLKPQVKDVGKEVNSAIARVLKSGTFILDRELITFENKYASFVGVDHCVGTANGFDAIVLSLWALNIGPRDEVIVPANTCMPTWMAVAATGATIVPVEPEISTYNINPALVAAAITSKTKAIIPVHLYGQPCDMRRIMEISYRHHVPVIEDNAQAHGASVGKQRTGSFGLINAHSFYPSKNLGALGDGGAITTNDPQLCDRVRAMRNYGGIQKGIAETRGINSRLDELQAAILNVKLRKLNAWNRKRAQIAALYRKRLTGIGDIQLPQTIKDATPAHHLYVIRSSKRDELKEHLAKKKIGTMIHYPVPPHLQPAFTSSFRRGQFPITEELSNTCLSLPLWPGMSATQVDHVVSTIRRFFV